MNDVVGSNERQLLYTVCCDESLAQSLPMMRKRAVEVLESVDTASYDIYQAGRVICESMSMYCEFLLASPYSGQVREFYQLSFLTSSTILF